MEGLLPAIASAFQLILGHLWGALLVISESLSQGPGLPAFPWEILVCTVVVALIVKTGHTFTRGKSPGERCSARAEVSGECGENTGPENRAEEALQCPRVETSPLPLRTLCLAVMNTMLSTSALQDTVDLLEKVWKSLPLKIPQVTDTKPTLKASEKDDEQLQKNTTNDLNENTHFPARPLVLHQDMPRWEKTAQEKEEKKGRLEQSNTQTLSILKDQVSQILSAVAVPLHTIPLPDLLAQHMDDGNAEVQQKREAEKGEAPIPQSEVGLKGVTDDADLSVPLQSPEEEHQEGARRLWQEKQMKEELPGQILSLQTEEASLQHENAKLESDIQKLKLKLQILHELHDEEVGPLYRKFFEEERVCSELDKKLLNVCWDMNSTYQLRNLYKKMAEDPAQEVQTCTSYYHKENLFQMQRAEESRRAAVLAERKLEELRRENEHNRQRLAMLEASFQPLPRGNFPPAAPPMVPRGPEVWGIPWAGRTPQKEDGPAMRPQGPGVACRFDSASTAAVPSAPQPREDICTGVLFSKEF
uniref:Uncharacterized protein n=1 Tax=Equus caballus TaxID=9796 RepID=A0A3Q2HX63_HORSE